MDVLIVNYEYPPKGGGGGMFTKSLHETLREFGHDARVVTSQRSTESTASTRELLTFPFKSVREVFKQVVTNDSDLIDGHFSVPSSLLLPIVARLTDTPLVVTVIGADVYDPTRYARIRPLLNLVNFNYILPAADHVVTSSTDMRDRLPANIRRNTSVIPYNVDPEEFTPPESQEESGRLLSVCRLVERKNLKTALEVVAALREDGREVTYTIAGDGPLQEELEAYAEQLGIEEYVEFLGYVDHDQLPELYREHDVFFLPSHHEGFGIVYLEAMASGLPVVASDEGGQADFVTSDVGRLAPANRPEKLVAGLEACLDECETMATAARERVLEQHTPEATAEKYVDVYESITEE